MKVLIAIDSFKESLSSQVVNYLAEQKLKVYFPKAEIQVMPIADGGEGTLECLAPYMALDALEVTSIDPLNREIQTTYFLKDDIALIEMAQVSGLERLAREERNPLETSSEGLGILIKDALDRGVKSLYIGIGGSATNDAGIGMLHALGGVFYDKEGPFKPIGAKDLKRIERYDFSVIDSLVRDVHIKVLCDVTNTLLGPRGATHTFAKQKGASDENIIEIESYMKTFAAKVLEDSGIDLNRISGGGAAGGVGASLSAFLKADLMPGIEAISDILQVDKTIESYDLIITGEGKIDQQTLDGKVVMGIHNLAKSHSIPIIAVCGIYDLSSQAKEKLGLTAVADSMFDFMTYDLMNVTALKRYEECLDNTFRILKLGQSLSD